LIRGGNNSSAKGKAEIMKFNSSQLLLKVVAIDQLNDMKVDSYNNQRHEPEEKVQITREKKLQEVTRNVLLVDSQDNSSSQFSSDSYLEDRSRPNNKDLICDYQDQPQAEVYSENGRQQGVDLIVESEDNLKDKLYFQSIRRTKHMQQLSSRLKESNQTTIISHENDGRCLSSYHYWMRETTTTNGRPLIDTNNAAATSSLKETTKLITFTKIKPKVYFANERTFLAWLNISVSFATISLAILA
jgi:hypothetical protein